MEATCLFSMILTESGTARGHSELASPSWPVRVGHSELAIPSRSFRVGHERCPQRLRSERASMEISDAVSTARIEVLRVWCILKFKILSWYSRLNKMAGNPIWQLPSSFRSPESGPSLFWESTTQLQCRAYDNTMVFILIIGMIRGAYQRTANLSRRQYSMVGTKSYQLAGTHCEDPS